jgi:nucleotide-binding universal stress UspA family protein
MSVVICYDGSDSARRALAVARQTLGNQRVVLLQVWSPPDTVLTDAFSTPDPDSQTGPTQALLEAQAVQRAREVSEDGEREAAKLGLVVEVREVRNRSSVWRTILDAADDLHAELIVAGTHGTTAVQDQTLGSVSDGLVHHSERPVLIVPSARRA